MVRLRVFEFPAFTTVIAGLLKAVGAAVNTPVWVDAVGALASKVTVSTVRVEAPLIDAPERVPTVPVEVAAAPPATSMLQSLFTGALGGPFFFAFEVAAAVAAVDALTMAVRAA